MKDSEYFNINSILAAILLFSILSNFALVIFIIYCHRKIAACKVQLESKDKLLAACSTPKAALNAQLLANVATKPEGGKAVGNIGTPATKALNNQKVPLPKDPSKKGTKKIIKDDKNDGQKKDTFQMPSKQKPDMADAKDPNYHSLKGLANDVFEKGKSKEDKEKEKGDNNYETLGDIDKEVSATGVGGGEDEEKDKEQKETKKPKFRPPDKIEKVGAKNPQYETLAGIDDQLFKKKEHGGDDIKEEKDKEDNEEKEEKEEKEKEEKEKEEEGKPKKNAFKRPEMGKVSAKNPQYETFADLADDIFKGKK